MVGGRRGGCSWDSSRRMTSRGLGGRLLSLLGARVLWVWGLRNWMVVVGVAGLGVDEDETLEAGQIDGRTWPFWTSRRQPASTLPSTATGREQTPKLCLAHLRS